MSGSFRKYIKGSDLTSFTNNSNIGTVVKRIKLYNELIANAI